METVTPELLLKIIADKEVELVTLRMQVERLNAQLAALTASGKLEPITDPAVAGTF